DQGQGGGRYEDKFHELSAPLSLGPPPRRMAGSAAPSSEPDRFSSVIRLETPRPHPGRGCFFMRVWPCPTSWDDRGCALRTASIHQRARARSVALPAVPLQPGLALNGHSGT